jgi:curved DNA-binding protein
MEYKDYYKILGISTNATNDEVKKAYRKLATRYHPDKNPGDASAEQKFKDINEARQVLIDPEKRKLYDRFGADWKHYKDSGAQGDFDWSKYAPPGGGGRTYYYQSSGDLGDLGDIFGRHSGYSDFFENLFGGSFQGQYKREPFGAFRGQDLNGQIRISLEQAFHGSSQHISLNGNTLKVNLKPGIQDGYQLKLTGKGRAGVNGGINGDLYLTVKVSEHPRFKRKGDDLYCDLVVDLYTAILGGKVALNTFSGNIKIDIAKETQNNKTLRLKDQGMPKYGQKNRGDLYVRIVIETPDKLSKKEVELFKQLRHLRK